MSFCLMELSDVGEICFDNIIPDLYNTSYQHVFKFQDGIAQENTLLFHLLYIAVNPDVGINL